MVASVTLQETLTFEQVRGMLAHRFPFLMIDRVMELERGKRLRALKHVTGNELCFLGHFPEHAIFPGVLIIEAMAQAVSLLDLLSREVDRPPSKYLGSANAKFLAPVVPGDSMEIEAVLIKQAMRGVIGSAHVSVQGKAVARAEIALGTGNGYMSTEENSNGGLHNGRCPRKAAVVTGGSRGLGQAIVQRLACSGYDVLFTYSREGAPASDATPGANGSRTLSMQADVRDAAAAREVINTARSEFGGLHVLVNNAGITRDRALTMMSESDWSDVLDVNLSGAFLYSQAAASLFMRQMSGRIINITSISGLRGVPGQSNYSAAKAGMIGMTKAMARELGPFNVTVNAVAPGYIETQMVSHFTPQFRAKMTKQTPMGRFGCPQEVSGVVEFLASDAAGYVTGQTISVDGGLGI